MSSVKMITTLGGDEWGVPVGDSSSYQFDSLPVFWSRFSAAGFFTTGFFSAFPEVYSCRPDRQFVGFASQSHSNHSQAV